MFQMYKQMMNTIMNLCISPTPPQKQEGTPGQFFKRTLAALNTVFLLLDGSLYKD